MKRIQGLYHKYISRRFQDPLLLNASFIVGNNVVNALGGFLFWFLAARLFSQSDVGVASSIYSMVGLLSGLGILGLGSGLVKFLSISKNSSRLLNTTLLIAAFTSIVFSVSYIYLLPDSSELLSEISGNTQRILIFSVFVMMLSIFNILVSAFIGYRKAKYSFFQFTIFNFLKIGLLVFFVYLNSTLSGIINALLISTLISVIFGYFIFLPKVKFVFLSGLLLDKNIIKKIMAFSFGSHISNYLFLAPSRIAPILALEALSEQASANTYFAWMIALMVTSPGISFGLSALAEGSSDSSRNKSLINRSIKLTLVITLPLVIIATVFGETIVGIFGADYLSGTIELYKILMISTPFAAFTALFFAWLRIRNNIKQLVIVSMLLSILAISYPVFFLEKVGTTSFGIGWFIGNIIISAYGLFRIYNQSEATA